MQTMSEEEYERVLRALIEASSAIDSTCSIDEALQVVTDKAREIIGAHLSVTILTIDHNWAQSISAVSLSQKYAQWRTYDARPDGSGIYALACRQNEPVRMTQAELEAHPAWRGFGKEAGKHPPCGGGWPCPS